MARKLKLEIPLDADEKQRLEEAARRSRLAVATWARQALQMEADKVTGGK